MWQQNFYKIIITMFAIVRVGIAYRTQKLYFRHSRFTKKDLTY